MIQHDFRLVFLPSLRSTATLQYEITQHDKAKKRNDGFEVIKMIQVSLV